MQKLIVHIEFADDTSAAALRERIDEAIPEPAPDVQDIGWRFFNSLEAAQAWENGDPYEDEDE